MKMYPPALINKQVTEDMLHWMMMQPNTVTMNTTTNEFNITPAKGAQDYPIDDNLRELMLRELMAILAYNGFSSELLSDDKLKVTKDRWSMEIENILQQMPFPDYLPHQINKAYEHYNQELNESLLQRRHEDEKEYDRLVHGNDHLYPYEAGWTMASKEAHAEQQRELNRSYGEDDYPSRERLESIRQTIIDNTEGEL